LKLHKKSNEAQILFDKVYVIVYVGFM